MLGGIDGGLGRDAELLSGGKSEGAVAHPASTHTTSNRRSLFMSHVLSDPCSEKKEGARERNALEATSDAIRT